MEPLIRPTPAPEVSTKNPSPSNPSLGLRRPLYYGWVLVAACFLLSMVTTGSRQGFGAFFTPMREEFGWSFTEISIAATVGMLCNGLFQPFIGRMLDRFGGRVVILVGLVILGTSTFLLVLTPNIVFLVLMFGVISSMGLSAGSINTCGALLTRWFRRRRATALGICTSGASMGGLVIVPVLAYLIGEAGWRMGWIFSGALIVGVGLPLAYFLLRDDPADMGLQPDGDPQPLQNSAGTGPRGRGPLEVDKLGESFRSQPFWQLTGAYLVCGATTAVMSVHFIPHAEDLGMSTSSAALAFGVMSGLNVVGVYVASALADRFQRKNVLGCLYAGRGLAYLVLLTVPLVAPPHWAIWAFAIVVGFSWIATAPLTTTLAADVYGVKFIGTISGLMFLGHQIGAALSIQFAGIMRDVTGSYTLPFAVVGSFLLVASIIAFSVKEKQYSSKYQEVRPVAAAPSAAD